METTLKPETVQKLEKATRLLMEFTLDVLPQVGRLAIQRFDNLNEGLILGEQALRETGWKLDKKVKTFEKNNEQ